MTVSKKFIANQISKLLCVRIRHFMCCNLITNYLKNNINNNKSNVVTFEFNEHLSNLILGYIQPVDYMLKELRGTQIFFLCFRV